uniref:DUF243 domain-containing protein n=1 Tax=Glossina palpalis gambiensis TaxID=67801 RepID=A0A3F2Z4Q1_9MUSC
MVRAFGIALLYYGYVANLCLAASIVDNGHLSNANNLNLRNLLPKSLVHDIQHNQQQQQQQQQQYFDRLIHNDIQYAQRLPADQSVYYANSKRPSNHNEIIDVQVPTRADASKILLHLPKHHQVYSSASPSQPFYVTPRRHYRITLIRNHKPAPPSPPAPEVEQNTLIYVLIKKPDQSDVNEESSNKSEQNSFKLNPPEVYFINYKANKSKSDAYASQTNTEQRYEDTSKV